MSQLRLLTVAAIVSLSLISGCGARQQPDPLGDGPLVDGQGAGVDPVWPLEAGEDKGVIQRRELDAVLLAGPQTFIQNLRVSPAVLAGKFVGYRIEEFFPDNPRFRSVDLLPGDVIVRVNGQGLERPDQFMKVWEALKTATELRVDYLRGALVRSLRWGIVDEERVQPAIVD